MAKAIVLCSDGTGNSAIKDRGTNVFRLYEALDLHQHEKDPLLDRQLAFYDDGVGTQSNPIARFLGNAFGYGLARNVRELYASLCEVWEPGDRIYLFGFSRGAYTARYLAALIATCGVVQIKPAKCGEQSHAELEKAALAMFELFRAQFRRLGWFRRKKSEAAAQKERDARKAKIDALVAKGCWIHHEAPIAFVGVWDTVDAYGFPADWIASLVNQFVFPFRFPDFELDPKVARGCHAIALDDERKSFRPSLWDERREDPAKPRIEQVWFAGVHSNVGGGYPKQGLALESLCWMIDRAKEAGLRFVDEETRYFHDRRDPADKLYDSRAGMAVYYSYEPRDVGRRSRESLRKGDKPRIHLGAIERIALRADGYGPLGLPQDVAVVTTEEPGEKQQVMLRRIEGLLAESHGEPVLRRAAVPVALRRLSHIVMLVATLLLVIGMYWKHHDKAGVPSITEPVAMARWLVERFFAKDGSWILRALGVLPIVAWVVGSMAKGRIERVASRRWYDTADKLRTLLADYHAARAPAPRG